ncbi:ABC transporter permease [bacterium]|nr:MAG: ABC transporter permease [bacterium]
MNTTTFYRILKNGFLNYSRNFWLSVAATTIMVITIFVASTLLLVSGLANLSLQTLQDKVDISVYFKLGTSETVIQQIQKQIELLPEVKSVAYIPSVVAREKFKQLHKDEPALIESVDEFSQENNPFPASFAIRVQKLTDYATVISIFQEEKFTPFVQKITDKGAVVDRLNRITMGIKKFGLILSIIFAAITIIVIFNTIRLTIYNRREEIEIMRLVGASNWFIRGPFVIEGIFHGVAGALISTAMMFPIIYIFSPKVASFLEISVNRMHPFGLNLFYLFGLQILAGILIGVVSSMIVVRKYLKV